LSRDPQPLTRVDAGGERDGDLPRLLDDAVTVACLARVLDDRPEQVVVNMTKPRAFDT